MVVVFGLTTSTLMTLSTRFWLTSRSPAKTSPGCNASARDLMSSFTGNYVNQSSLANRDASVLYVLNSAYPVQLTDCTFSNNVHVSSPNEIRLINAIVQIDRSRFVDGSGVGFYQTGASSALAITNSLIYGYPAAGIQIDAGTAAIASSTVVDNGAWGLNFNAADLGVENSIFWGNGSGGITAMASGSSVIQYTASQEAHAGTGNFNGQDPLFAGSGDYALQKGSTLVNAGISRPWMSGAHDLAGNRRVSGGAVDLGAYELAGSLGTMFIFH